MNKKERQGEPDIYSFLSDDPRMNEAILQARNSLHLFDQAILANKLDIGTSALKVRFNTSDGGEHIWATQISIIDGVYYGKVDNVPDKSISSKLDEGIEINKDCISDWMYLENGVLRGGFTIRYIRDQLSPEEKAKLDASFKFVIDD